MGFRRAANAGGDRPHRHAKPPAPRRSGLIMMTLGLTLLVLAVGALVGVRLTAHPGPTPPITIGTPVAAPPPPPPAAAPPSPAIGAGLAESFAELTSNLNGTFGIAFAPVGDGTTAEQYGDWTQGPAWSTMKVPLSIAVLREQDEPSATGSMTAAITASDNGAADALWRSLGDPDEAAAKMDKVLREAGDPTSVQSRRVRPPFSAFGQTQWSLVNQVRFIAAATCDTRNTPVLDLMGQISSGQRWGLGTIDDTHFKGGWGPMESGGYLVRQLGIVPTARGQVAVAIAAQPSSGSFSEGTADLSTLAGWLSKHIDDLPAGTCPAGTS